MERQPSIEEVVDFKGRIHEVRLTDEQYERLQRRDFEGAIQINRLRPDDGLDKCVLGVLADFFDTDDSEIVIVPGSEIVWWLERLDEEEAAEGVLVRPRQPYIDAYGSNPRKAFSVPVDRGDIARRPVDSSHGTVIVEGDPSTEVTLRRDPNLHSSDVRT